jgi:magnesium chelatase family protein
MLARVNTFAIDGVDARPVWAEVDVRPGLPSFHIVGLADAATREARERVRGALRNTDFAFPANQITANLAPAHMRKVGPGFDAALAVGILAATQQCSVDRLERFAVFGELTLSGELRPCRGTLAAAQAARRAGLRGLIVPSACALEAASVDRLQIAALNNLPALVQVLAGGELPPLPQAADASADEVEGPDVAELRGHQNAVRALEIAAAGSHPLLLVGARGTGLLALARRLPGLLPPLSHAEALEVTRIHSIAGLHRGAGLVTALPFRAPHHTITPIGLLGGGHPITPGEASLSHRGVLLLDELAAFQRVAVQALSSAVADGQLTVVRGGNTVRLPARSLLVATASLCPGNCLTGRCHCSTRSLIRYRTRLAPRRDPFEMRVNVEIPDLSSSPGPSSSEIRDRVVAAREFLRNTSISTPEGGVEPPAESPSGAPIRRALHVARTIAALDGRDLVMPDDVDEAGSYTTAN